MIPEKKEDPNPLKMYQLENGGPYVLPSTECSSRRKEFFQRGNTILTFYTAIALTAKVGQDVLSNGEKEGKFREDTPFRVNMEPSGGIMQFNYGLYKKAFSKAGAYLTNQVFLMLYGNFEAFVTDLVLDSLYQINFQPDPYQEALNLMSSSKWRGKIDRITKKIGVNLGIGVFVKKFQGVDMGFLGEQCHDPIEFMEKVADFRHRLVHYGGRIDKNFLTQYPKTVLKKEI
jgi:hypothetical protein